MDRKVISIVDLNKYEQIAQLATLQLFDFSVYIEYLKAISNNQKENSIELYKKCHIDFNQTIEHQKYLVGLLIDLGYLREIPKEVEEVVLTDNEAIPEVKQKDNGIILDLFSGKPK
jgi:hypothetical protein